MFIDRCTNTCELCRIYLAMSRILIQINLLWLTNIKCMLGSNLNKQSSRVSTYMDMFVSSTVESFCWRLNAETIYPQEICTAHKLWTRERIT